MNGTCLKIPWRILEYSFMNNSMIFTFFFAVFFYETIEKFKIYSLALLNENNWQLMYEIIDICATNFKSSTLPQRTTRKKQFWKTFNHKKSWKLLNRKCKKFLEELKYENILKNWRTWILRKIIKEQLYDSQFQFPF